MKRRFEHAQNIMRNMRYEFNEISNIIDHVESYERIIKKMIDKRDSLAILINNPTFNINCTDQEMTMFRAQYYVLHDLLKGVE